MMRDTTRLSGRYLWEGVAVVKWDSLGPVDPKGPQGEESASFMARIVGLLVLGLVLVMVGFAGVALFWLVDRRIDGVRRDGFRRRDTPQRGSS